MPTHNDRLIEVHREMGSQGPALLYAREVGDSSVPNLGWVEGLPDLSLVNGASLGPGLVQGGASAVLDGVNDYLNTGWETRTNLNRNPGKEAGTAGYRANFTTPAAEVSESSEARSGEKAIKVVCSGGVPSEGLIYGPDAGAFLEGVASGEAVTASEYVKAAAGTSLRIELRAYNNESKLLDSERSEVVTMDGDWQRMSITIASLPAGATKVRVLIYTAKAHAAIFYVDDGLIEESEELGDFFPTPSQIESGLASQDPVTGQWDLGVFARGSQRTFMGVAERPSAGVNSVLVSNANSGDVAFQIGTIGQFNLYTDVSANGSAVAVWPGAFPSGERVVWALAVDTAAGTAELFINGASKGLQSITGKDWGGLAALCLGRYGGQFWPGSILPFAVYTEVLGAAELARLHEVAVQGGRKPPVITPPTKVAVEPNFSAVAVEPNYSTVTVGWED